MGVERYGREILSVRVGGVAGRYGEGGATKS